MLRKEITADYEEEEEDGNGRINKDAYAEEDEDGGRLAMDLVEGDDDDDETTRSSRSIGRPGPWARDGRGADRREPRVRAGGGTGGTDSVCGRGSRTHGWARPRFGDVAVARGRVKGRSRG